MLLSLMWTSHTHQAYVIPSILTGPQAQSSTTLLRWACVEVTTGVHSQHMAVLCWWGWPAVRENGVVEPTVASDASHITY